MERLNNLQNLVSNKESKYVSSALDYMKFDELLTPEEVKLRKECRKLMEEDIGPHLGPYIEQAKFPEFTIPLFQKADLMKHFVNAPYGTGSRMMLQGILVAEMGRVDASIGTFFTVQACLALYTIQQLGNEEQKQKYIPELVKLNKLAGWGLTEKDIGSDASNLETRCRQVEGGWVINGNKRWIGNGDRDIVTVWARDEATKKVKCFIVDQKAKGVRVDKIQNKMGLRMVTNCQIYYDDVFVEQKDQLVKAQDWLSGTNVVLKHSRIIVGWNALGVIIGCYDHCIKYVMQRKQFGIQVAGYQLIQERLSRIMGDVQSCIYYLHRVTILFDKGQATMGQIALCKAQITRVGRDVARLGRECLGGNGIIHDNYLIKAVNDIETMYTYEGTYDVNSLIVGRDLTGLSAFKNSSHKK